MKLIILDRDGVINEDSDAYIKSPEEWVPLPGSLEAIARLNHSGYHVAVATNQSGVGRGYLDIETLNRIHQKMHRALARVGGHVDGIFFCPHAPEAGCSCRKPAPGLLQQIAERCGEPLSGVPVVGDSLRDLQAGIAVGARPILVRTGKGERTLAGLEALDDLEVYPDLSTVVARLIDEGSPR